MTLAFQVQKKKRLRVIVDTDAACEADDPFAIAHALMSPKFVMRAIFAEQFGSPETTKKSYDEIQTILSAMSLSVPVYMGAEGTLADTKGKEISPASAFLIEEAMRDDDMPLFVLCQGAITNVASALQECPEIASRMTVVWIAGHEYGHKKAPFNEFNSGNDIPAGNIVLGSGVELWLIPSNVYCTMHIGIAELQKRVYPCGDIGKHLFEQLVQFNASKYADWTPGESWSLGDSPAIGVALNPNCGRYEYKEAPIINEDTSFSYEEGRPLIRVYQSIDVRYVLEDFMSKLELIYG
ncbi:nucleoside hydrolase [Clostridium grantii]|uniref:Inosine-uridine nucleoside N-ribohydrolase n=1 Tax=Clostridium grantii DSM 8605 TaxID=1121316 RepID=A0A1M5U9Z1_9CLOT|nr:nucleoside hydrolase [Clostridium grantii]SHH59779.1 Inosine-uridine nucleoside N-ribohydrolase [Clostridium grantii DSM 8605]